MSVWKTRMPLVPTGRRGAHRISPLSLVRGSDLDSTAAVKGLTRMYDCTVQRYSYVGRGCLIQSVDMGSFCSIGDNNILGSATHETSWVSTSPMFQGAASVLGTAFVERGFPPMPRTKIAHDVWIGNGAILLGGRSVGVGAIIGAGAVVTRDVPDYAIAAGNPARIIRYRFTEQIIDALLASRWWELPDCVLQKIAPDADDPEAFLAALRAMSERGGLT